MVLYPPIAKRFCYFDDEFLKKKRKKYDLDCFSPTDFLGYFFGKNAYKLAARIGAKK